MIGASGSSVPSSGTGPVESEVSVHFVCQNRQIVPIGEVDQRAADRRRIHGAGRIVRIDDDEHPRAIADEAAQRFEIRQPVACGVSAVVARDRADLGQHRRVERIRRQRDEHFIPLVDQRVQRQIDGLRRAGRDQHAVRRDCDTALLRSRPPPPHGQGRCRQTRDSRCGPPAWP